MPITADNDYRIDSLNAVKYRPSATTKVFCPIEINKDNVTIIHVQVWDDAGTVFYGEVTFPQTEAELEAYTSAESGEFSIFKNVCEQAAKAYLEAITANVGVAFTIV